MQLPGIPYFKSLTFIFLGIMISGGYEDSTNSITVEIYDTKTRRSCSLPNMPSVRYSTVTKEFLVCGGKDSHDCIFYNTYNGTWQKAHKLNQRRYRYTIHHTTPHTPQHSTAQHSTAQHSTAQHSTTQHNTTQHATRNTEYTTHATQNTQPSHHRLPHGSG